MDSAKQLTIKIIVILLVIAYGLIMLLKILEPYTYEYHAPKTTPSEQTANIQQIPSLQATPIIERIVSAYTASADETDNTPCIGALPGINFCDPPYPIIATNELALGTKVIIDNIEYLVADRMNPRYKQRYDILVNTKQEAYNWGVQTKQIIIK